MTNFSIKYSDDDRMYTCTATASSVEQTLTSIWQVCIHAIIITSCTGWGTRQLGLHCKCRNELWSKKLHWLPVEQHISYKIAVLTFKVRSTSMLIYLNCHMQTCQRARDTQSSATPALFEQFTTSTMPNAPSAARLQMSGTRYPGQWYAVSLCRLLNLS